MRVVRWEYRRGEVDGRGVTSFPESSIAPVREKAFWHPQNYEILSGQLRMPGLSDVAEKEALKGKMNSYW